MISITVRHHNNQQQSLQARWAPCGANLVQVEYARNAEPDWADAANTANQENQDKQQGSQQNSTHHARSISLVINPKFHNQNSQATTCPQAAAPPLARRRSLPRRLRRDWNRNCRLVLANEARREPEPAKSDEGVSGVAATESRPSETTCQQFRQAGAWLREISDQFSK